jgi:glutamine amidotransferase-like uncharacterized protein
MFRAKSFSTVTVLLLVLVLAAATGSATVTPQVRDFAIYVDAGTWQPSIVAFENFLTWKNMTWQEIDAGTVNSYNLSQYYKGIWIPGGWAADYKRDIKDQGDANIRELVSRGGVYSGASAGAYYACDRVTWEGHTYPYTLDLFDGDCVGPIDDIAPWPDYVMTTMNINSSHPANVYEPSQRDVLYYGEPYFVPDAGQEMLPMAHYIVPSDPSAHGKPGIIGFNYGSGRAVLLGPHLEVDEDNDRDGTTFGDELSDGPDGSDWPFLWTAMDWMLQQAITQAPPENPPPNDTTPPTINSFSDSPDPVTQPNNISFMADVTDNFGVKSVLVEFDGANHTMSQLIAPVQSQLFFDGFEAGSFGGNWKKYCMVSGCNNWTVATTNPYAGSKHAQVQQPGINKNATLEFNFTTEGYLNITLRYYRRLVGLDSVDSYYAQWWNGTKWQQLEAKADGSGSADDPAYVYKSFILDSSANDNAAFKVRFICEAGAVSEYCRVDNFELLGTAFTTEWHYSQGTGGLSTGAHNYKIHASDFMNNTAVSPTATFTVQ